MEKMEREGKETRVWRGKFCETAPNIERPPSPNEFCSIFVLRDEAKGRSDQGNRVWNLLSGNLEAETPAS